MVTERESFEGVAPIRFAGPDSSDELAFRYYDPDRLVRGKRMEDHLRFAVCYWHSFCWPGDDVFGQGAFERPWFGAGDPMALAEQKLDAAFELFVKLGVPFFTFHDRDIAPEGKSFRESCRNLDTLIDAVQSRMERSGVKLLLRVPHDETAGETAVEREMLRELECTVDSDLETEPIHVESESLVDRLVTGVVACS